MGGISCDSIGGGVYTTSNSFGDSEGRIFLLICR